MKEGHFRKRCIFIPTTTTQTGQTVKLCSVVDNEGGGFHAPPQGCFQAFLQWYHGLICFGNSASATCRVQTQAEAQTADMSSDSECKRDPGGGRCRGAASALKGSLTAGGRKEIIRNGGMLTGNSTHACARAHAPARAHARVTTAPVTLAHWTCHRHIWHAFQKKTPM